MAKKKWLTQDDLAKRWQISPRTLERWRWKGEGPTFFKVGGRVRYEIDEVEAYERDNYHTETDKRK